MKRYRILLLLLGFLALFMQPWAQAEDAKGQYVTTIYNERNGLPTGEANVVYQTGDCYVWIGSYGGLIRYDGTVFRNYSQEGTLPSSSVRTLMEDDSGRLWIGTNDAGLFVMQNDEILPVPEESGSFLCIRDLIQLRDGTIYAASSSGLARVEEGTLIPLKEAALAGQTIYSLGEDASGRIWAVLNDWQCVVLENEKMAGRVFSRDIFPDGEQIYAVASDQNGTIYLGTYEHTVAQITFPEEGFEPNRFEIAYLDTGSVTVHNALNVTADGDVLVSGQLGFAWIEPNGEVHTFGEETGAAALNGAMRDYEGNLWLASSANGVIKYSVGCFTTPNLTAGLDHVPVNTVVRLNGRFYVGTDSGLMIFDDNWQPVNNELTETLQGVRIRQLLGAENGKLWLATYSSFGTICYNPVNEQCVFYHQETGMENCWSRTLLELHGGDMAVGTSNGFYILSQGKEPAYYGAEDGLENTTVLCFAQDEAGTLYIGTDGGGMYALKEGQLTSFGKEQGLEDKVVLRILPDAEGLFVSAGSSLYYYGIDQQFRKLDAFDKAAGSIFDMYLKGDSLWLLQNSGVLQVHRETLLSGRPAETKLYSFQHGLTGSLNANTWHWSGEDDGLYLATRSGISVFAFRGVKEELPKGIIHSIRVDGVNYEHPDELVLASDVRRITIDFSALTFTDTDESSMAYFLEGLDQDESVITGRKSGSISYTNLPGGTYTFHLRLYHPENSEVAHHYQVKIHKEKQLKEQPVFWVMLGLGFAGAVGCVIAGVSHWLHRARMRRMQERQKELQVLLVQSLQTFARIIDAKDPYTNGHSIRVAQYARELARRMNMPEHEQERIYYVALLHDIGKIGIPDNILNKQGPLTPEERAVIQTHPQVGGRVLKDFTALDGITDGAKYHHERYDGKGYCDGKRGKEIPLVARIIGVADSYDAMSSDRCYRAALSREKIIEELTANSGTQFDPEIVPYMLKIIEEDRASNTDETSNVQMNG